MTKLSKTHAEAIAKSFLGAQAERHAENRARRAGPLSWMLVSKGLLRSPASRRQAVIGVAKERLATAWGYWLIVVAAQAALMACAWWWSSKAQLSQWWAVPFVLVLLHVSWWLRTLGLRWQIARILAEHPADPAIES